ncbi:molybdopterin-guanine dinucleotide biosynthesis protein B [Ferrovum sp.]|jgi:molybdopterin-guanine dinucleotide biosynthesis protein B|uniref:molybdopterin-guanine dinucleotide biosynthesis protein B n=1 Tax=Ferrovum sp. TaxID=2609467 RepID=UPI0026243AA1|nr:molybdopterin-guanine dinucleotide biosynthesis protein B [Ferrovum sp.]
MKLLGIVGYSGSGKTTLIEKLIPWFMAQGLRVSVIKHAHHQVDLDQPGKDSWRFREVGCQEVLLVTTQRWILMHENRECSESNLENLTARFSPCDLVLVEGFKHGSMPKLEVWRTITGKPPLHPDDANIFAVATDRPVVSSLPQFNLNQTEPMALFIAQRLEL